MNKALGKAIIIATREAMELGLDIRQVYIQSWSGDSKSIDFVEVVIEHNIQGEDQYATHQTNVNKYDLRYKGAK